MKELFLDKGRHDNLNQFTIISKEFLGGHVPFTEKV